MKPKQKRIHRRKPVQQYSPTGRKTRTDQGKPRLTTRDRFTLTWIGEQYAMRFDQVQELLGRHAGHGAAHEDTISTRATHNVIDHWKQGRWVIARRIDAAEPMWVWLTKKGLTDLGLPYQAQSLAQDSEQDRTHLYAITAVRLDLDDGAPGNEWISERMMLQGTHRRKGDTRVHRPDAVFVCGNDLIAIEVELSRKTESLLSTILVALLTRHDYHGYAYHALKAEKGEVSAQEHSPLAWRQYTEVSSYAELPIRRHIRRVLAKLVARGEISDEEAERIQVWWYPLAMTEKEKAQEEEEANASLDLED